MVLNYPQASLFVIFIVLACCGKLRRQVPANYILLGLFVSKTSFSIRCHSPLKYIFISLFLFVEKIFLWNKKIEIICETFS